MHRKAAGTEVAHGVYYVTGFKSFTNGGGSLAGIVTTDAIGRLNQTTGGDRFVKVHLVAASGEMLNGVLGVHCVLPGGAPTEEGMTVTVDNTPLNFVQHGGATLFHVLDQ